MFTRMQPFAQLVSPRQSKYLHVSRRGKHRHFQETTTQLSSPRRVRSKTSVSLDLALILMTGEMDAAKTAAMMNEKLFTDTDHIKIYAAARPGYPDSLYQKLATLTPRHDRAWDVGTGNGQAATMIAEHYKSVVATDVSDTQIAQAIQRPNISYHTTAAIPSAEELERVVGPEGSVDLVTVATALHYFELDKFYPVVKHVLRKPGGVFAAWSYSSFSAGSEFREQLETKWFKTLMPYWSPEARYPFERYQTIPFPFQPVGGSPGERVKPEQIPMEQPMTLEAYVGMLKSTSGFQNALKNGVQVISDEDMVKLVELWGPEGTVRMVSFALYLLVGTVSGTDSTNA